MVFLTALANGQNINGIIVDENNEPIEDVHIRVQDSQITTISAADGSFQIDLNGRNSSKNKCTLIATRVGYEPIKRSFELSEIGNTSISLQMKNSIYESETMGVTATRTQRDIEEVTIPVTLVTDKQIETSSRRIFNR